MRSASGAPSSPAAASSARRRRSTGSPPMGRCAPTMPTSSRRSRIPSLSAELLRALGWQVPETRREPPADPRGWLQKEIGGAGGVHVRRAQRAQLRMRAPTISARCRDVRCPSPSSPTASVPGSWASTHWRFARWVMRPSAMPAPRLARWTLPSSATVQARLDRLVRVTGLRGLNGIDFLLDGGDVHALEVNPRPTATFELYDLDYARGPGGLARAQLRGTAAGFSGASRTGAAPARAPTRSCMRSTSCRSPTTPTSRAGAATCRWAERPSAPGAPVLSVFAEARERGAGAAAPAAAGSRKCS